MLKDNIRRLINSFGFQVHRINKEIIDTSVYHRLYSDDVIEQRPFYNIGAGSFFHPLWRNVDFSNSWYKDNKININYDLMELKPLPIDSDSAEIIYTSHTLEHINEEAVDNILSESFRVLKRNGVIRITVPDVNLYYEAYINNDKEFYRNSIKFYSDHTVIESLELNPMSEASLGAIFLYYFAATVSPLTKYSNKHNITDEQLKDIFNKHSYPKALDLICKNCHFDPKKSGYHINWMNTDKIIEKLEKLGFSEVYASAYGQSRNAALRDTKFFDNTVPGVSCYIEARK
ncbi:class I SAM-dependent methyltransferase [Vibrio salilacus]|uniref:class I SAM-dependent methyltransferase n=1 Tax=Vibrio salilacus TaxID=1323749 RepID=UPI000C299C4F|nr:methyltransferase domain-containing protein [Vibrio salilacus]